MKVSLLRRAGAELVGTYALVTAGCGAVVVNGATGAPTHLGVALTFGLVITVMIMAMGHLSGAHFNPAVTVAFAVARHFPWREVSSYVGAQLMGAVLGALTLRALFGGTSGLGATVPSGALTQSLLLEVLLSAVLMLVIVSVATDTRAVGQLAAIAIGGTVALDALWGGPVSGASMNPARSFGPALVGWEWTAHWIYWVAPVLGTTLGALLYTWLRDSAVESSSAGEVRGREVLAAGLGVDEVGF
ncbi:MAG: MIP family channel protein [Chloroflexota bacterium]|nr:MIP family channel protein [Chloroflexota bacterium]